MRFASIKGGQRYPVPAIPRCDAEDTVVENAATTAQHRPDTGARTRRRQSPISFRRISVFAGLLVLGPAPLWADTPSRDAMWRSIFVRPAPASPALEGPVAAARRDLGERLFSDTRLSGAGGRACATCHQPERNFTDGLARATGLDGRPLSRNTPHLWNLAWATSFDWDGRASSLDKQARRPLASPLELDADFSTVLARLEKDRDLVTAFAEAFPGQNGISEDMVLAALAQYQRSLVSPMTRFDRWVEGDDAALTEQEKHGFSIFAGKAGCVSCHGGWRLTDDQFHDIGLPGEDAGRGALPAGGTPGIPAFKTPGLREVAHTAPYMHDGSLPSLEAVIDHYSGGIIERPSLSSNLVRGLQLSVAEKSALLAFLQTLGRESESGPAQSDGVNKKAAQ